MTQWTAEKRDKLPLSDFGDPENRKYPIADCSDVKDAWNLAGHADNPDAVRSRIKRIAKRKGLERCLPKSAKSESRIIDSTEALIESFEWNESAKSAAISVFGITSDLINKNRRLYPKDVLKKAVEDLSENLATTSARSGRRLITGEIDHPSSKGNNQPLLTEAVILWNSVQWDEERGGPILTGETFPNSKGKEFADVLRFLHDREMPIPISQRGYGDFDIQSIDGQRVEVVQELKITGYDFVIEQSDLRAGVLALESEENPEEDTMEETTVVASEETTEIVVTETEEVKDEQQEIVKENNEEVKQEVLEDPEQVEVNESTVDHELLARSVAQIEELTNKLSEFQRLEEERARLIEQEKLEAEMKVWLDENMQLLSSDYPESFVNILRGLTADNLDELSNKWTEKIKEYEPVLAEINAAKVAQEEAKKYMEGTTEAQKVLETKGFDKVESVKPMWEQRIAPLGLNIDESVAQHLPKVLHVMDAVKESNGGQIRFNPEAPSNTASHRLAKEMFERYIFNHSEQIARGAEEWDLIARKREEARMKGRAFDETPTLKSAWNLPYLVMAGIVPEVYASLVSPEVFTVMPLQNETQRYYTEAWGTVPTASVTNEAVTSDEGAWVALAHPFIVKSGVVVKKLTGTGTGTTTMTEYTDYIVDTESGRLWTVAAGDGGNIGDNASLLVSYTYSLIAEGENQPIEFISTSTNYATLQVTAKRLGFNLTDEAVRFATSDLGYDARSSALANATYRMAQELDSKMFELAEAYAYIGGMKTSQWTKTPGSGVTVDENLRLLVDRIADAIAKLDQYYYRPTHIVMARSIAALFHRTDLLDSDVNRAGISLTSEFLAGSLHGLPVYGVPYGQYNSSNVLVLAGRDVVVKGIYSPLEIAGGAEGFINRATSGDVNRPVAARAWYLQEYYDVVVPVDPHDGNKTRKVAVVPVGA